MVNGVVLTKIEELEKQIKSLKKLVAEESQRVQVEEKKAARAISVYEREKKTGRLKVLSKISDLNK